MIRLTENLKILRRQFSRRQIAEKLHIGVKRYSAWESGKNEPNIIMLKRIADYYGITIDALCFESL